MRNRPNSACSPPAAGSSAAPSPTPPHPQPGAQHDRREPRHHPTRRARQEPGAAGTASPPLVTPPPDSAGCARWRSHHAETSTQAWAPLSRHGQIRAGLDDAPIGDRGMDLQCAPVPVRRERSVMPPAGVPTAGCRCAVIGSPRRSSAADRDSDAGCTERTRAKWTKRTARGGTDHPGTRRQRSRRRGQGQRDATECSAAGRPTSSASSPRHRHRPPAQVRRPCTCGSVWQPPHHGAAGAKDALVDPAYEDGLRVPGCDVQKAG